MYMLYHRCFSWLHINQDTQSDAPVETVATLCIDPGHGGYDAGTSVPMVLMKKTSIQKLRQPLEKKIEKEEPRNKIIYTRDSDENYHGPKMKKRI